MIVDARALRTEFIPRELHHREGHIEHLSSVLSPVSPSDTGEHVCIYGPSGAGKTTLARYTLNHLEAELLDVRWGYVNCIAESSKQAVLAQLVRDAGLGKDLRRSGTPTAAFFDRIRGCEGGLVAVLDEVDVLAEPNLIISLADLPDVSVVTICIDEDQWLANADERLRSRLRGAESITLEKYAHDELVDILQYRVDHGLAAARVDDVAVRDIADRAAGNARVAIALLRRAAKRVVEDERDQLTVDIVDSIAEDAHADVRDMHVRSLGTHQRALYSLIRAAGSDGIAAGSLHDQYEDRVEEPKTRRTRRRYLQSLERYDLITTSGSTRNRQYRAVGP
jgi:Cdc6-like AAA superfamily ATPase